MTEPNPTGGDTIHVGDIRQGQGIAVGRGARADVHGHIIVGAAADIDADALRNVLKDLRSALGQAGLPYDVQLQAETAAGNAVVQGIKGEQVEAEAVVSHVEQVANSLKQANVVVQEGSLLWASVQKLAPVIGPLVAGGGPVVAGWFGVPVSS